ncbi:LysM peptidoglycan-binding domain-containing protein [Friedmanniella luteola]|uniref:LysM peptidoglycan-binding domain-containing protein n=1 Tax=Friedmanniella luteola TaxID=546871 RepID=UPI001560DB0A|nr:LysM peptidoglycan-binding domain-containing protein [Friedmanniella luteola]
MIPDQVPSPAQIWTAATTRDDGTLALASLTLAAWAAWLLFAVLVVIEVVAQLRGRAAPRVPGFRLPQVGARELVSAALLLFLAAPLASQPAPVAFAQPTSSNPDPADNSHSSPPQHPPAHHRADQARSAVNGAAPLHTVRRGESLWSIAADRLGSGLRYTEIVALNTDTLHGRPGFLTPGQTLKLPAHPPSATNVRGERVRVQRGDTLSDIAEEQLGDADRYPEIFRASTPIRQPDGRHLTDPDIIDVGWTLTIPTTAKQPHPDQPKRADSDRADPDRADQAGIPTDPRAGRDASPRSSQAEAAPASPRAPSTRPSSSSATPQPSTTPASSPPPPTASAGPTHADESRQPEEPATAALPAWALTGLTGAGALLAASLLVALRRRRACQFRARRPGRTIAVPPPLLAPVEKTLVLTGDQTVPTLDLVDQALRRLAAARAAARQPMPDLAAVELTPGALTLHLAEPAPPTSPWQACDDQPSWRLPASTDLDTVGPTVLDQPAPYPLLVTIGASDDGAVWLLNCEQAGVLAITGDPLYSHDLARYLAAEIACNPWSEQARLDCLGIAQEVKGMNPERVHAHPADSIQHLLANATADAAGLLDRSHESALDVPTGRAHQVDADAWPARMLLLELPKLSEHPPFTQLLELVADHPARTGTAVVLTGQTELPASARTLAVTGQGRLTVPHLGLDLIVVGLTTDEAEGCAALLAQADTTDDQPVPAPAVDKDEEGWRGWADAAGAIRAEHTLPRTAPPTEPATTLLDGDDQKYLEAATTTINDLAAIAPQVPVRVRAIVEDADPTLDADLTAWREKDCDLPRLTLLGPVWARTHGTALAKRRPYYTELLAYLATRPRGATPDEVADAIGISGPRVRTDIKILRDWLGTNPRTGRQHLPDARDSDAARTRGIPTYQVDGLLLDADLFRRLRVRGETRGPDGINDLRAALTLVTGRPFDQLRPGGWTWMIDGDRLDQHLLCAIVDVAHLLTTHALKTGNLPVARAAAETAILAAPYEEIPLLDLAAVAAAEGHPDQANQILHDRVYNRSDDGAAPTELPARTSAVLHNHPLTRKRAS